MLGRHKRAFERLCVLLRELEHQPNNVLPILEFHEVLLSEVLRAEGHIARHRAKLGAFTKALKIDRPSKAEAVKIRKMISRTERMIAFYQQKIFIWKCFGDGLAFIYLDKYSVKHTYFETTSTDVRQRAGFITGKAGLTGELSLLHKAIEHNVPAILCDLTNTLRHGDVCLLGDSDPVVIEVKSSENLSKRARRQIENNQRLQRFLETDQAAEFRGFREVRRSALTVPERHYINQFNSCIERAYQNGHCVIIPEDGLRYIAMYDSKKPVETLIGQDVGRLITFSLNGAKMAGDWMPYLPFTLSIRSAKHLYDFIEGNLFLIVTVSADKLCQLMARSGWSLSFSPNDDYAIRLVREDGAHLGLSQQFIGRIGFEFLSLAWVAEMQSQQLDQMEARLETPPK
jgi:hypothetical protein